MKAQRYKTLTSKIVHQNRWFKVRQNKVVKPNGERGEYNVVETPPSVFIVAMTEKKEIYLVKLYRYPTKQYSWEVPGGNSDGQKPLVAAKRELWEETGLIAKKWKKLGKAYPMNGIANEVTYVFLAQDLVQSKQGKMAEEGIIQVKKFPFKKILQMVKSDQITDGQTLSAVLLTLLNKESN